MTGRAEDFRDFFPDLMRREPAQRSRVTIEDKGNLHRRHPGQRKRTDAASARRQHHRHLAAFQPRLRLDLRDRRGFFLDAVQELHAEILMRHLTAPEAKRKLYLVAIFKEALGGPHLHVIIMIVDVRAHLDLLDLDDLLLLAGLVGLFLGLILEPPVVHDLADRRRLVRRDLDQVQPRPYGEFKRALNRDGAVVFTLAINQLNFMNADFLVCPRSILDGGLCLKRSTNGDFSSYCERNFSKRDGLLPTAPETHQDSAESTAKSTGEKPEVKRGTSWNT